MASKNNRSSKVLQLHRKIFFKSKDISQILILITFQLVLFLFPFDSFHIQYEFLE